MFRFNDWRLKSKLYAALAVPMIVSLAIVWQAYVSRNTLGTAIKEVGDGHLTSVSLLLNADRDLYQSLQGLQNSLETRGDEREKWVTAATSNLAQVEERWGKYKAFTMSVESEKWGKFEAELSKFRDMLIPIVASSDEQAAGSGVKEAFSKAAAQFETAREALSLISDDEENVAATRVSSATAQVASINKQQITFSIIGILVSLAAATVLYNRISGSVGRTLRMVKDLAGGEGDLTRRLKVESRDELGQLSAHLNAFLDSLFEIVKSISDGADTVAKISQELNTAAEQQGKTSSQVATAISEVAQGAADQNRLATESSHAVESFAGVIRSVSEGSQEQKEMVVSTRATVDRMLAAVQDAGEATKKVAELMESAAEAADNGTRAVGQTLEGMEKVRSSTHNVSSKIGELSKRSEEIASIVEVIRGVAEQTNLLALNAAIEAARAGEHGRGFAVVADEVRKLAENTAKSARQITELIQGVNDGIESAVSGSDAGLKEIENAVDLGKKAGSVLEDIAAQVHETKAEVARLAEMAPQLSSRGREIAGTVDKISTRADESAAASAEMSAQSDQVVAAIHGISDFSQKVAATAEEVSASAEEQSAGAEQVAASADALSQAAGELNRLVARFKLA
ncbi:MAG: methyl-accepting chemotaxis protein [Firmicutes bacterium]|nr:methyl-accepting chemotaxis protein [Bacillota bacterium]